MSASEPLRVEIWGQTDRGRVRPMNEDSFYCPTKQTQGYPTPDPNKLRDKGYLLTVADGIGGATAGQEASRHVVSALRSAYYESPLGDPQHNLAAAVGYANDSLYQTRMRNPVLRDAGSTVVAGVIHENKLYLANVGDSRAYLIRGSQAFQSTKDHTVVQEKTERGLPVTEDDKSVITRSMGAAAAVQVDLYPPIALANGEAVLLCSDGLSELVSPQEIGKIVSSNPPRQAARKLVKLANDRGGHDNITVVIATVGQQAKPPVVLNKRHIAILAGIFVLGVLFLVAAVLALRGSGQPAMVTPPASATRASAVAHPTNASSPTATTSSNVKVTVTPVSTATPVPTATKLTVVDTPASRHTPTALPSTQQACSGGQVWSGTECACPADKPDWLNGQCVAKGGGGGCPDGYHKEGNDCVKNR